jgi:hypothetical protein
MPPLIYDYDSDDSADLSNSNNSNNRNNYDEEDDSTDSEDFDRSDDSRSLLRSSLSFPHIFSTLTANAEWSEIISEKLTKGQTVYEEPDVVSFALRIYWRELQSI